jgi:thiamine kinase-like enzyme
MNRIVILSSLILVGCSTYNEPANHSCNLKKICSSIAFNSLDKNWTEITPLKGGLSDSTLYKVSDGKNLYVIRSIAHRSQEDKIREIQAQKIASEEGYGPKLYGYDMNKEEIVMSFLQTSEEKLDPKTKALKLADLLKSIHNGPKFCDHPPIIEKIKSVFVKTKTYFNDTETQKFVSMIAELENLKPFKKTATHRDLNPNNIIFSGGNFKVIDFEDSGQNDSFFDIATIIVFNFENTHYEQEFLKHYFGRNPSQKEIVHLNIMKKAVFLCYGLDIMLPINFYKALEEFEKGYLSLANNEHLLMLAKSMLNMAIELDNKNTEATR